MGCGASAAPKSTSKENLEKMCQDGCRRMQVVCIKAALDKDAADIKIAPPQQVQDLQQCCEKLKEYAAKLNEKDGTEEKKSDGGGGGMMGSVMAGVAKAKDLAADAAASGTSTILSTTAGGLKALTDKLDAPFQTVAKDVVDAQKAKLYNIYVDYINGFVFKEPIKLVRGDWVDLSKPSSKEKLMGQKDLISRTLNTLAGEELCKKLLPAVTEQVQKHAVTNTWQTAEKAYNSAFEIALKVVSEEDLAKAGVKKVECDLNVYITGEIYKALVERMAATELATRGDPVNVDVTDPKKPISFAKIFSPDVVLEGDYDFWAKEGVSN